MNRLPFEIAHHMALLPLLFLGWLHVRGQKRGAEWYWLATAFYVSWLADSASHVMAPADRWLVMAVYPLSQAALVGFVFLMRKDAVLFLIVLMMVGVGSVLWHGVTGPDVLLRTVAWGGAAGIVLDRWALGRLRVALLVYFGLGLVCWYSYAFWPGWTSWSLYQSVRLAGILAFCWAAMKPGPSLRVEDT